MVGHSLAVLAMLCALQAIPLLAETHDGDMTLTGLRVARDAVDDITDDKRYSNVQFGKRRAKMFEFGKRRNRVFEFGKRGPDEDDVDIAPDEYAAPYYSSDQYHPSNGRNIDIEDILARNTRKVYQFGKRESDMDDDDIMDSPERRRAKTFQFGKRGSAADDEKRRMVQFGKRRVVQFGKRRQVQFGKRPFGMSSYRWESPQTMGDGQLSGGSDQG